ncbi:hypothetical protein MMC34_003868 [Xylographa carneopallida]|nr:hypothetical protein [Xylographa carneopallida]
MEPVFLGQPVFNQRPISPLTFEPFLPLPEDIILPGSSDEDSEGTRKWKKRRREDIGYQYLRQLAGYTITFKLKGPFENGWRNPYRDHGVVLTAAQVVDMRKRREACDQAGVRASSPIDITSSAEEDEDIGKHAVAKLHDRKGTSTAKRWLTSNVQRIRKRQPEDAEAGSPTPRPHARMRRANTVVSEGPVKNRRTAELEGPMHGADHGEENEDESEEEVLEEPAKDESRPEQGRSPSVELEYSSQSQSRHREASEVSEGGHLNVQSPTTKPRLERRVLVKRIKGISQRLRKQQYGSDAMDELLLEKEVLDDRVSALSSVIADMKESGDHQATVRKKRGRDEIRKISGIHVSLVGTAVKREERPRQVPLPLITNAKTHIPNMKATPNRKVLSLSPLNVSYPNREAKPEREVFEQVVQADPNPDLLRMPSFRTDSSEISHAVSLGSNEKQRSERAIRKSEKRREHKHEKRHKAAQEKLARQGNGAQTLGVDQDDDRNGIFELDPSPNTLASTVEPKHSVRPHGGKQGWSFGGNDLVIGQSINVKNEKLLDASGGPTAQQNKQAVGKGETTKQPRRPARKKYQSEAKDKENATTLDIENTVFGIKSSGAVVGGTKGKRVPIIIVDDYDSSVSSSQISLSATCPTGWKPYKWLPGGQDYAERVLREHLASIEAGGPSIDPFRSSVGSSSNESSNTARKRNMRETKADLRKLSSDNIVDLTDLEMPKASQPGAPLEGSEVEVEVGSKFQSTTLKPHTVNRRASVNSVDTAWKKDQSSFFGGTLSSGPKEVTQKQRHNREYSKHEDEVSIRCGKTDRNNLVSMSSRINNDGMEPAATEEVGVLTKDNSDQGNQVPKMTEEKKRAAKALTATLVSFMDTSSEDEVGKNGPKFYAHSLEDASPGHDQALPNSASSNEVDVESRSMKNIPTPKHHVKEASLVAADVMVRDDVTQTSREVSAAAREVKAATVRDKKDKQNTINERRSSREEFLQSLRFHVSQKASKNLLSTHADATAVSPHVPPASTNLSQFQYNRVDTASRSASSDTNPAKRKQKPTTPALTKAQPKRRISFTPKGNVKSGVEVRVPAVNPQGSQASPILIEDAPVALRTSPTKKSTPLVQKPSEGDASRSGPEILPEAQGVAEKLPSGPSSDLLETDKQLFKFPSTEETDPSEHFSTQAELAKAQESFRRDLQSPVKLQAASSPSKSPLRRTSASELHQDNNASMIPLMTSRDPCIGAPGPDSSNEELPSTQAMVDAMSPFAISTIKKPRKFLHSFTRPAAAVYGYIWGSSQEERNMPANKSKVEASSPVKPAAPSTEAPLDYTPADLPMNPSAASPTVLDPPLEPAVSFGYPAIDMATSDSLTSSPAHTLSQPSDPFPPPLRRPSRRLNSAHAPSDDEASDFEQTQKERGLVRDDRGRWSNLSTELSMVTPSQRTLRSYHTPRMGSACQGQESASQDGQRRSGVKAAIEDAESWLGTWDVEGEVRRMGGGASAGGGGVGRGEMNRVVL